MCLSFDVGMRQATEVVRRGLIAFFRLPKWYGVV